MGVIAGSVAAPMYGEVNTGANSMGCEYDVPPGKEFRVQEDDLKQSNTISMRMRG